ncbi:hypothetical protein TBLA_0A09620 [Henningerozyma blattae CBS 6284]|uniref:t-SNARE coiled-coil homology domain-containing protein n=1 Tax=Henningerozyma blattae (strain ATCC 34711 / CBS 6284 / DSM 70876 / NBRC 10599 / NRRL Y-10934 / UCD 77-7) TaxID=1071380 RepID=I2GX94_HENB6|nr:hypothetical protein TBLA_0A09620 [Tetrapisispora blattae CBS 6284]CCH58746.1 hypothetical protein TBLA_0A09620 [Tetrapisispora blattae CBS 6284]
MSESYDDYNASMVDPTFSDDENSNKYHDSPEFETLKDEISANLFEINGQIATLNHFFQTLQTFITKKQVNSKVINNIDKKAIENIQLINGIIKNVNNNLLIKINNIDDLSLDKVQLIAREKLIRDVRSSIQEFQWTQKNYTDIIKKINDIAKDSYNKNVMTEEETALLVEEETANKAKTQTQTQLTSKDMQQQVYIPREAINNEELTYQQTLIRQRDEEILNIENGINEINEIFKDLGAVIQQQSSMVDNIEANIYSTVDNTRQANEQLNRALNYQRRSNKFCLHILFILLGIFFFFLFLVLI